MGEHIVVRQDMSEEEIVKKHGSNLLFTGYIPFRDLETVLKQWRKENQITRVEVQGSFSKVIETRTIEIPELKNDSVNGARIRQTLDEDFDYTQVFAPNEGTRLNLQKIFIELNKQRIVKSLKSGSLTIEPKTLYIRSMTTIIDGKNYEFKGKVPKDRLKLHAKRNRKKGDMDKKNVVLDLQKVHDYKVLKDVMSHFTNESFAIRCCKRVPKRPAESGYHCVGIYQNGKIDKESDLPQCP